MHSRVNDVKILLTVDNVLVNHSRVNSCHIVVVHFATDNLNLIPVGLKLNLVYSNLIHLLDDTSIVRSKNLCAIAPLSLVTVILLRVVRSGNVYTSLCAKLTDSKRNFWCRTQALEEISLDAISREDSSYSLSKKT